MQGSGPVLKDFHGNFIISAPGTGTKPSVCLGESVRIYILHIKHGCFSDMTIIKQTMEQQHLSTL